MLERARTRKASVRTSLQRESLEERPGSAGRHRRSPSPLEPESGFPKWSVEDRTCRLSHRHPVFTRKPWRDVATRVKKRRQRRSAEALATFALARRGIGYA